MNKKVALYVTLLAILSAYSMGIGTGLFICGKIVESLLAFAVGILLGWGEHHLYDKYLNGDEE